MFSLAPAIAFVTNLSIFRDDDVKLWWKGCADAIWHALESLVHEASLKLPLSIAALDTKALREEDMQGLAVAICRLEAAVVAIFNKWNLTKENKDLHNALNQN